MPDENKPNFVKIAVKPDTKREIDIIAATEQRYTYEVVDEMLKLYKASVVEKPSLPSPIPQSTPKKSAERREPVAA